MGIRSWRKVLVAFLISNNNVFPRGKSSVCFQNVAKSIISNNRFHSFYPGMLSLEGNCSENMISSNHFLRDNEPWKPMLDNDNGLDDSYRSFVYKWK